jgi:hypothetical protein
VILYGIIHNEAAPSVGGAFLTITALALLTLVTIRKWIVDTSAERRTLAEAQRHAEDERSRYVTLQAALTNEQGRLSRGMAAERAGLTARLNAEREVMQAELEESRATIISETMEDTVRMMLGGKFAPEPAATCNLIQFPQQQPERERSREHGVVGP